MDDRTVCEVEWFFSWAGNLKMIAEFILLCAGLVAFFPRDTLVVDEHIYLSVSVVSLALLRILMYLVNT